MRKQTTAKLMSAAFAFTLVSTFAGITRAQNPRDKGAGAPAATEGKAPTISVASPKATPSVAADYVAPKKPLPPAVRVGVDATEPMPLTLNEAIKLALENNNDIATSR